MEYGFILKCILQNINSPKQIHKNYIQYFGKVTYNQITNMLSKLTNQYHFLYKNKKGKISNYYINYSYVLQFIDVRYFKLNRHYVEFDYNDSDLILYVNHFFINSIEYIQDIITFLHQLIVLLGFEFSRNSITKCKNEYFVLNCTFYLQDLINHLDSKQKERILGRKLKE